MRLRARHSTVISRLEATTPLEVKRGTITNINYCARCAEAGCLRVESAHVFGRVSLVGKQSVGRLRRRHLEAVRERAGSRILVSDGGVGYWFLYYPCSGFF